MAVKSKKTAPIVQTIESSETVMIPLKNLFNSEFNVRKVYESKGIESLAASIAAEGVIQNLVVVDNECGAYNVIAGGRRLAALNRLADDGVITREFEVPCQVKTEASATAISLAENFHRESLHPADEFVAFKSMIDDGASMNEVTSKFKVTPDYVKRRMKLGSVSPKLIEQYREGRLDLDQIMALAITDDHAKQEKLMSAKSAPDPWKIRKTLTEAYTDSSDKRAKFVDPKAYKAAGGEMIADLFDRGINGRAVNRYADPDLLHKLALEQLEAWGKEQHPEASFIHAEVDFSQYNQSKFVTIPTVERAPTDDEANRIKDLEAEKETVLLQLNELEEGSAEWEDLADRYAYGIDDDIQAIQDSLVIPDTRYDGKYGYVTSLNWQGEPKLHGPFVRAADIIKEADDNSAKGHDQKAGADDNSGMPASLKSELSWIRASILTNHVAETPGLALRLVCYEWTQKNDHAVVSISSSPQRLIGNIKLAERYPFFDARNALDEKWAPILAKTNEDLRRWIFRDSTLDQIFELFAYLVGRCVAPNTLDDTMSDAYGEIEKLMASNWHASADGYFSRLPKPMIIELLGDKAPANADSLKKKDLAAIAEVKLPKYLPDMFKDGE